MPDVPAGLVLPHPDHALLDAGDGRRLERFADVVVDRPSPVATWARRAPDAWAQAALRWERGRDGDGRWAASGGRDRPWTMSCGTFELELRPTDSGQVGAFPEQAPTWAWLAARVAGASAPPAAPYRVLDLFASTGAATLAAAAAGAEVAHVDAARTAVAWARRNADLSGLSGRPIRWLVDDAAAFVARERRRGRRYEAVVLDPPSYGHGPGGRAWTLGAGLPLLLADLVELGGEDGLDAMVVTAHTRGLTATDLAAMVSAAWPALPRSAVASGSLELRSASGLVLPAGVFVRAARP